MNSDLKIRTVGLEALEDVARLFEASIEDHRRRVEGVMRPGYNWTKETRLRLERDFCRFVVAYVDGRAVGFQVVHFSPWRKKRDLLHRIRRRLIESPTGPFEGSKIGILTDVYVEPDYRRRGIARAMVKAAMELLEAEGAEHIYMDVMADNEPMLGLADSLGFERRSIRLRRKLS